METIFLSLLNMSIAASWLVLALVVLRLIFKKLPKWTFCALWVLVGIRLLLPISFESRFSIIPSAETIPPNILYSEEPTIHSGIGFLNSAVNPYIFEALAPNPNDSVNPSQIIFFVSSLIWVTGTAVMLIFSLISCIRLRRRLLSAVHLHENIWQSENVTSPFALGIFHPHIYLPFNIAENDIEHIIAHEKAHIIRHDNIVKPLGFLLLSLYWFNPFIWLAYILLCRDIELACDEYVIKELEKDRRADYSSCLLRYSVDRRSVNACPLAYGKISVKNRVKNVLGYKKPAFWIIAAAGIACLVLAVTLLTNPVKNKVLPDIAGHDYMVNEIIYQCPIFSFGYINDTAPHYRITDSNELLWHEYSDNEWKSAGMLKSIELNKSNFDACINYSAVFNGSSSTSENLDPSMFWNSDLSVEELRENCILAWRTAAKQDTTFISFYVFQLEDGSIYLSVGYAQDNADIINITDIDLANDATWPDQKLIRWLFKLTVDD